MLEGVVGRRGLRLKSKLQDKASAAGGTILEVRPDLHAADVAQGCENWNKNPGVAPKLENGNENRERKSLMSFWTDT